jgi:site-specific recombinase XerD
LVQQVIVDGEKRLQNLYTPYSLRHFYASMLIAENKDLKTIQELKNCQTTPIGWTYE